MSLGGQRRKINCVLWGRRDKIEKIVLRGCLLSRIINILGGCKYQNDYVFRGSEKEINCVLWGRERLK